MYEQNSRTILPVDFMIITPLEEERDAILNKLPNYQKLNPFDEDIYVYYQSDLLTMFSDGTTGVYRVVVMPLLGMGRVSAADAAKDAIHRWKPRYIILVGIAGGVKENDVSLGDVLVPDQIVDYELQKLHDPKLGERETELKEIRWKAYEVDPRLLGAAHNFVNEGWQDLITAKRPEHGTPKRHIGPILSGDKVVASSAVLARYLQDWPKLIGVEMEAGGVAIASFRSANKPGFFMIRGVSDQANKEKGLEKVKQWRPYACDVAAVYTVALLESGPVPLLSTQLEQEDKSRTELADLDERILLNLYAYFGRHRGNPKMSLTDLVKICIAEENDVIIELNQLRERGWVNFDLLTQGRAGLVWLTAEGIRVARAFVER